MLICPLPTPHFNKLTALAANTKVPSVDRLKIEEAVARYHAWVKAMDSVEGTGQAFLDELVRLLNEYKRFIEIDLIYDSPADFLYRQKGQHKVDNSVLEEFLPRLADTRLVPGLTHMNSCTVGPQKAFAAFTFAGTVHTPLPDGGMMIRVKDQDYALSKKVYLKASTNPGFTGSDTVQTELNVAYIAAELKTNLDKTMFNEGLETARALKQAVAGSKYLLVCEWLDMSPINTASTDIEEAIILHKARRLGANFREGLATVAGRAERRDAFVSYYESNPLRAECFARIVYHLNTVFPEQLELDEGTVLTRGYF